MSRVLNNVAISVFSRAPVPGNTKTRLIRALGAQGAARLHRGMLRRVLEVASTIRQATLTLVCTPDPYHPFFDALQHEFELSTAKQRGNDLGERMSFELNRCLKTHAAAIVVGSDCPFIQPHDYLTAFEALLDGTTVALGPSRDGGYYLIGLSQPAPALFKGISWGTDTVLESTLALIKSQGFQWLGLPERSDIDTPDDLAFLPRLGWSRDFWVV